MPPLQRDIHLAAAMAALGCAAILTLLLHGGIPLFACAGVVTWLALHGIVQYTLVRIRVHWRRPAANARAAPALRCVPVPSPQPAHPHPGASHRRMLRDDEPLLG